MDRNRITRFFRLHPAPITRIPPNNFFQLAIYPNKSVLIRPNYSISLALTLMTYTREWVQVTQTPLRLLTDSSSFTDYITPKIPVSPSSHPRAPQFLKTKITVSNHNSKKYLRSLPRFGAAEPRSSDFFHAALSKRL